MTQTQHAPPEVQLAAHALSLDAVHRALGTPGRGLTTAEAEERLSRYGPNALPRVRPPSALVIFLRQFASPLIYVLLAAAGVSMILREWSDAGFIFAVLLINAVIGGLQEYNAQRSAEALQSLVVAKARVVRDGEDHELDVSRLVPGDLVLLEAGARVPADLRLVSASNLEVDESLLTGESLAVAKRPDAAVPPEAALGDRVNLTFAGTMVNRGRARGLVVATGARTELGRIARSMLESAAGEPPLLARMRRFTGAIGLATGAAVLVLGAVSLARGAALAEVFMTAVALAVSAIPEGLPVALSVTLAIAARRMSRRNVIARRLVAVEALGSCTFIASDKTGTLTVNELTARRVVLPGLAPWPVTGEGVAVEGEVVLPSDLDPSAARSLLQRLCVASVLCNDAFLGQSDGEWVHHGDAVDVALLVLGHKAGVVQAAVEATCPREAEIPFEAENRYSAVRARCGGRSTVMVKGAVERLLPMCEFMATPAGDAPVDRAALETQAEALAAQGYRVLAVAAGPSAPPAHPELAPEHLEGLVFLGLVGMIDPLRPGVRGAVAACRRAGIEVAMVTGDHPVTALAIARDLGMAERPDEVVTGPRLREVTAGGTAVPEAVLRDTHVFARVEPTQKLDIVQGLTRLGHFVAVTGDGANDAAALRAAHIGVAMGGRGTDVARESAELILADDDFESIVAGVQEGRIAYANVRKVVFLLVSTGAAEILLFVLALAAGLPLPLLPVQLLWLNLVTNGIQDVALAFEPGEGGELDRPPRSPRERIFDRLMVERTVVSALVMGGLSFLVFRFLLERGLPVAEARNVVLLLMVLFENVQAGNSRSETRSLLRMNPLHNPLLLFGTLLAQGVHIAAMYVPGLRDVLGLFPVSLSLWTALLVLALSLLATMEVFKAVWARRVASRRSPP